MANDDLSQTEITPEAAATHVDEAEKNFLNIPQVARGHSLYGTGTDDLRTGSGRETPPDEAGQSAESPTEWPRDLLPGEGGGLPDPTGGSQPLPLHHNHLMTSMDSPGAGEMGATSEDA